MEGRQIDDDEEGKREREGRAGGMLTLETKGQTASRVEATGKK